MATRTNPQTNTNQSLWEQLTSAMSRGITPYILLTAYAIVVPFLAITNLMADARPSLYGDILFVAMLGTFLLLHKAPVTKTYSYVVAGILLCVVLPYFGTFNQLYMDVMIQIGMFCVLTLGLNVVVGFAGLLDLGYIAFYAVGAYLWAIFSTNQAANILPAMAASFPLGPEWFIIFLPLALVIGAIFGVLLGLPVLRLRGDYLAIVTLGFGEVIRVLMTNLDRPINISNGAQGIKDIGQPPLFLNPVFGAFGFDFNRAQISQLHFYVMVLAVLAIMLLVVNRLNNSRIGRAWTAIREDETAAIAMGVPLVQMKLLAFVTGASFAGVMGMIFAAKLTFINPPTFDLIRSINILAMVILGGMGSIPGALLGATLVTLLNLQLLPRITAELEARVEGLPAALDPAQYQRMIFGLLLVLMTIFRPQGLLPEERRSGELHSDTRRFLRRKGRSLWQPPTNRQPRILIAL
ncbi:MAG: branched-chain amino acid ABC transporter permease [Chloroflexaceae bacterium]|nr:branched-chain amino acid ABC transporter permease [Chloroflexaceae bacterium]